jgi:dihydroxyacetone kinase
MLKWSSTDEHGTALMVNNLGGLSVLELNVIAEESIQQLKQRGLQIVRVLIGTFLTSLDGRGFSLTLLELDNDLLPLFDAPCSAPAWPRNIPDIPKGIEKQIVESGIAVTEENGDPVAQLNGKKSPIFWLQVK